MIKMQSEMSDHMKINHIHSLLRKGALQLFRNIYTSNKQTLINNLPTKVRQTRIRSDCQTQIAPSGFSLNAINLSFFLEDLNQGTKKAFGDNSQSMIGSLLYAKLPPKLSQHGPT